MKRRLSKVFFSNVHSGGIIEGPVLSFCTSHGMAFIAIQPTLCIRVPHEFHLAISFAVHVCNTRVIISRPRLSNGDIIGGLCSISRSYLRRVSHTTIVLALILRYLGIPDTPLEGKAGKKKVTLQH